jgi:REP element-mobilizing transposase RayT
MSNISLLICYSVAYCAARTCATSIEAGNRGFALGDSKGNGIRREFVPFDGDADFVIHGRHLPHWRQCSVTYFVTFRLTDSLPRVKLEQWIEDRSLWRSRHPEPWSKEVQCEYRELFRKRIDRWLDAGEGACLLGEPGAGSLVASALHHFDGERYVLDRFVVMPNHVHVLVCVGEVGNLSKILHSWKSFTAHALNDLLARQGRVWQDESFNHIVRSVEHLNYYRAYICKNPSKARLRAGYELGCGSGLMT